ncbi:MAG: thioredoxin family protein [Dehalococcoidia bacterium]|nr:MAG: thioredoxin family protein [Dehalococcoidia bacterium]
MVQQKQSVVTPERFAQGLTYAGYLEIVEKNRARFEENYAGTEVSAEDTAALRELAAKPNGPAKLLVLGEDWCPDVVRGMPVFARMAEAAGFELRIFPRDKNKDIMAEFLHGGEFESIPVAVFYTKDLEEIAHFIERPELANKEVGTLLAPMYRRLRKPDMTPEERAAARAENIAFQSGPVWANWRQETIRECIALLRERVK